MKAFDQMPFHPTSEKLVEVICRKTGLPNEQFFRTVVASTFADMASAMRVKLRLSARETQAINFFGIALSPSGTGKDFSKKILEEQVIDQFIHRFLEETLPTHAEDHLPKLAIQRASRKASDPDEELVRVTNEYAALGNPVFNFDSATIPAVRQYRHKLLMANLGALNLQVNEIGSNLLGKQDEMKVFIELYDGKLRPSLTKNTQENARNEEIRGVVPANLLLFGTPAMLLQAGSKLEENFHEFLESGYARRCFFAYFNGKVTRQKLTPEQELARRYDTANEDYLQELSDRFGNLADLVNAHTEIMVPKEVHLESIRYMQNCQDRAETQFKEHQVVLRQEMSNRHFKALKLAGVYAFVDGSPEVTQNHLEYAIRFTEESGNAFFKVVNQEKHYVKLARYIADMGEDVTQADLDNALPFYKGPGAKKQEMMQLAISWGYKNNIIIKKAFQDGIEFLRGESLKVTDLTKTVISYSSDYTTGYQNEVAPFDQLHRLTQLPNMHWVNHHLIDGYRSDDKVMPGFNLLVIDVDNGTTLAMAKSLLKDYKALYYTTKRHGLDGQDRFRIILPTNYELKLDMKDYKEFMRNVFEWLPFRVDDQTGQRSRKWMTHTGHHEYTDGELFDVLPFIPKTSKNEERKALLDNQQSLDNLERWVMNNTGDGNRNNMLLRYAMILLDGGFDFEGIRTRVIGLNDKLADKLDEVEIMSTIMVTVGRALSNRP